MRLSLIALGLLPTLASAAPPKGGHAMTATAGATNGPTSKTPSPCSERIMPLAVGNMWTYSMVPAPLPADPQVVRISPAQASTVVIEVKAIDTDKKTGDTTVTLAETTTIDLTKDPKKPVHDDRTIATTITCNAKKFEISPDSFLFAGEPGGFLGLKLESVVRPKGTSLQLTNGGIGDAEWREDLTAQWTRLPTEGSDAKLGSGKLELERQFTPQPKESVSTKLGSYTAEKLGLVTTGRVTLDQAAPDAKPMELPAAWVSTLWIADGAGLVQSLNAFAHMYQLTAVTLK